MVLNTKERVNIPNNIQKYRQQKTDLSQAKLAKIVGISETHYQKIEYGKTKPNIYTGLLLAEALNVDVGNLRALFPLPTETNNTI